MERRGRAAGWALALAAIVGAPASAAAFCGFYVGGGGQELYNDATQVVLMREGTKTVLSMQNNYQGPPQGFAMVVPVPEILDEEDVKTLPAELFATVDQLSAPRLVEYWERDPCEPDYNYRGAPGAGPLEGADAPAGGGTGGEPPAVVVEAEFSVGEYDVVILSATEAGALDTWLRTNQYAIPTGAEPIFSQYIAQGMYFFVAKVDPAKVTFEDGQAVLSPLRFAYDAPTFSLPVRLGMVNSSGVQDLLVYILSREGRFEVANRPNITIPTNIEVEKDVKLDFATFYKTLFEQTSAANPDAVVTEYAWDASTCDPCPGPMLEPNDYLTLGDDVITPSAAEEPWRGPGFTLTRLHARYAQGSLSEDLVFRKAPAIVGGREFVVDQETGELERGSRPAEYSSDNFQGRYIMRNRWSGEVSCDDPIYGRWGGPLGSDPWGGGGGAIGAATSPNTRGVPATQAGDESPLAERELSTLVREEVVELGIKPRRPASNPKLPPPASEGGRASGAVSGGACAVAPKGTIPVGTLSLLGIAGLLGLRRRQKRA